MIFESLKHPDLGPVEGWAQLNLFPNTQTEDNNFQILTFPSIPPKS